MYFRFLVATRQASHTKSLIHHTVQSQNFVETIKYEPAVPSNDIYIFVYLYIILFHTHINIILYHNIKICTIYVIDYILLLISFPYSIYFRN